MNHSRKCRERFEEIFTKDGDPRLLRQVERMGYDMPSEQSGERESREIPERKEDEDMPDVQEEEADQNDDMLYCLSNGERLLNSLTPDETVMEKIKSVQRNIDRKKRDREWNDGVREMHRELAREGIDNLVMEVFSPPRVNGMAERLGIMPGLSLDLTGCDQDDGKPWDFNDRDKRAKAMDMVLGKKALLVIGSPMCKSFSKLMNWNWHRMDADKREEMKREGRRHLKFCMMLYKIQMENGMYFLTVRQVGRNHTYKIC